MKGKSSTPDPTSLSQVSVRPVRDPAECAEWGRLMDTHHHLGFRYLVGGGVHNVTQDVDGLWLALLGWKAGSSKVAARNR